MMQRGQGKQKSNNNNKADKESSSFQSKQTTSAFFPSAVLDKGQNSFALLPYMHNILTVDPSCCLTEDNIKEVVARVKRKELDITLLAA